MNTNISKKGSENVRKNKMNKSKQSKKDLGANSSINKEQKKSLRSKLENKKSTVMLLRSKPAPLSTDGGKKCPIVTLPSTLGTKRQRSEGRLESKAGKDESVKRESTDPEEREGKRAKTGEESHGPVAKDAGKIAEEKSDWSKFLGEGDRLVSKMESLEKRETVSGSNDTQIKTAKEAKEMRVRYESMYKICRAGMGWMDDVASQLKVLEWRRLGATCDEEKRKIDERAARKKKIVKERNEKISRNVSSMREMLKEMRNTLRVWERKEMKESGQVSK